MGDGVSSDLEAAGLHREANGSIALVELASSAFPDRLKRLSGGQSKPNASDKRTETEKDRGRLSYSGYLRRLAGVTQVVSPSLTLSHLHTRESHTQKVALVAREIGEDISRRAEDSDTSQLCRRANFLTVLVQSCWTYRSRMILPYFSLFATPVIFSNRL